MTQIWGFDMKRVGEAETWEAGPEAAEFALDKNWTHVLQRSSGRKSLGKGGGG